MITVGLTGGIGSGKTVIAKIWEKAGALIIDADTLAKTLMVNDESLRTQLIQTFGENVYETDGKLNKSFLIKEAFHKNRVEELNKIVHPAVKRETQRIIKNAQKTGTKVLVKEAALLLKEGRPDGVDYVVWVDAPIEVRIKRASVRDGKDITEVKKRAKNQPSVEEVKHLCDFILTNDGNLKQLEVKALELYDFFIKQDEVS